MSIIFGSLVLIFVAFLPAITCVYYRASILPVVLTLALCFISPSTIGLSWLIAMIVAVCTVGIWNSIKSISFVMALFAVTAILGIIDMALIVKFIGMF